MGPRTPPPERTLTYQSDSGLEEAALAATVRCDIGAGGATPSLAPGAALGRYRIERVVGSGGMGVVYAAHDPDLERTIALKVVRPDRSGRRGPNWQVWLLREAQAMARLSHPNVIAVHDVGSLDDQVFVAMELVAGGTLRDWLHEGDRSQRDIVRMFVDAGRGLAAAHAAGIVHRDFKADNVLLGSDGRVRVTDFGLARAPEAREPASPPGSGGATIATTGEGSLIGTPRYMSPEQFRRGTVDARSDQFSFCVALYEALTGARAFEGDSRAELMDSVTSGRRAAAPAQCSVPRWLRGALDRGLAVEPADRFSCVEELLAVLDSAPARRRRVAAGAGVGLLGVAVAVVVVVSAGGASLCSDAASRLEGAWDSDRAGQLRDAFASDGRAHSSDSADRVIRQLDAYGAGWSAMYTDACEATHQRGDQSAELLDLRMQCLDERRDALAALVSMLVTHPSISLVDESVEAAFGLPELSACADAAQLRALVPAPRDASTRARGDALRGELAQVRALELAGSYVDGARRADALVAEAETLGYLPLHAEVLYLAGRLHMLAGDFEAAEGALHEAVVVGSAAKHDEVVARAWISLVDCVGGESARIDEADRWQTAATAAVARAGGSERLRAQLLQTKARLLHLRGDYAAARGGWRDALALLERVHGGDHPDIAQTMNNLGTDYGAAGDVAEAIEVLEGSLAMRQRLYGPHHPAVAESLFNLATSYSLAGQSERALAVLEQTLAIREPLLGSNHPVVADALHNLGIILKRLGRYDEAKGRLERSLEIRQQVLGAEHPETGRTYDSLGNLADEQGDPVSALAYYERAMAVFRANLPAGHPQIGITDVNIGSVLEGMNRCPEALAHYEAALQTFEQALGAQSPYIAYPLTGIGACELTVGNHRHAVASFERAVAVREASADFEPTLLAESQFGLARALWDTPRERPRAVELAGVARERYAAADDHEAAAEIDGWLAGHAR